MSFTPVANTWLLDRDLKIRSKAIPWDGYQRAGLLSAEDVSLIQRVAGNKAQSDAILEKEGETYASLYIRLLSKLSRNDTLQFVLVLIGDMIADRDDRLPLFLSATESAYPPLLKLLDSQDDYVRLKSSVVMATLLSADRHPSEPDIAKLLTHLNSLIRNASDPEGQDVGVQCLEGTLRTEKVRAAVWAPEVKEKEGEAQAPKVVEGLVQLLRSNPSSQMQYQLGFCFWLLTFDQTIAETINAKYQLIPLLVELGRTALKEKVLRIVLAAFRNLVTKAPGANLPAMLVAKLLPFVQSLGARKFSDDEVKEDVDFLQAELERSFEGLTTWDEYRSEVQSAQLSWTPTHKNDDFWRENADRLNAKDREVLKALVGVLMASKEPLVLAVAANDLAQYLRFCESARRNLDDLGAKAKVMELMGHPDAEVKYQALVATQRFFHVSG